MLFALRPSRVNLAQIITIFSVAVSAQPLTAQTADELALAPVPRSASLPDREWTQQGPHFNLSKGVSHTLAIRNLRNDRPIVVMPVLNSETGREIPLLARSIPASGLAEIDLEAEIGEQQAFTAASIVLRYSFRNPGVVQAQLVTNDNRSGHLLSSKLTDHRRAPSATATAVFWYPADDAQIVLNLQNLSAEPRLVTPSLASGRVHVKIPGISLAPNSTTSVQLGKAFRDLSSVRPESGALRVTSDGQPGDVIPSGIVSSRASHSMSNLEFQNAGSIFPDEVLRTNLLLVGKPPSDLGFSAAASFHSSIILHNTSTRLAANVIPIVRWTSDNGEHEVSLPAIHLSPLEVSRTDLTPLIPTVGIASLDLICQGEPAAVIAMLAAVNRSNSQVIESVLDARPGFAKVGTPWHIGSSSASTILIRNVGSKTDSVTIDLLFQGGTLQLAKQDVPSNATAIISLGEATKGLPIPDTGWFTVEGTDGGSQLLVESLSVDASSPGTPHPNVADDDPVEEIAAYGSAPQAPPNPPPVTATISFPLHAFAIRISGAHTDISTAAHYTSLDTSKVQVSTTNPKNGLVPVSDSTTAFDVEIDTSWYGVACVCYPGSCWLEDSSIEIGVRLSSYLNDAVMPDNTCRWIKTCTGTCTESPHYSSKSNNLCWLYSPCKRCVDGVLNGTCIVHRAECNWTPCPGVCS